MHAVHFLEPGSATIIDRPIPEIEKENDVIIKVDAIGLCGSDLATYRGVNPLVEYPRIPGHEIAGHIVQLGANNSHHLKRNQRVTVWPYTSCGTCSSCRRNRINCCRFNQTLGVSRDGAAQEFIRVSADAVIDASDLSIELSVLVEPLSVGWHAATRGEACTDMLVAVFGCGLIGLGAIAASRQLGARVIAIDIEDGKLDKAEKLGAEYLINSKKEDLKSRIKQISSDEGIDIAIEAVGNPSTFREAAELVCYSGRVVYIGYTKEEICYDTKDFVRKEIEIFGSRNALKTDFESVQGMILQNPELYSSLISHEYHYEKAAAAFHHWANHPEEVTKILLRF